MVNLDIRTQEFRTGTVGRPKGMDSQEPDQALARDPAVATHEYASTVFRKGLQY